MEVLLPQACGVCLFANPPTLPDSLSLFVCYTPLRLTVSSHGGTSGNPATPPKPSIHLTLGRYQYVHQWYKLSSALSLRIVCRIKKRSSRWSKRACAGGTKGSSRGESA